MPSERIIPIRMPESVLRSLDAAITQGLPAREGVLVAGLLNALIDASQVSPCLGCVHLQEGACASPALASIATLTSDSAPAAAAAAAHCTLRAPKE